MDLNIVKLRPFKEVYFRVLILNFILVATSLFLMANGYSVLTPYDPLQRLSSPILSLLLFLALAHQWHIKRQLAKLESYESFDVKIGPYRKIYTQRLLWWLISCTVACFLLVFTAKKSALYYAIFHIVAVLPYYPIKTIFRKELKDDALEFE